MAVYGKVIPLGAGDATVIRGDVDEASTMAHDAVADFIFQLEWVIAGRPASRPSISSPPEDDSEQILRPGALSPFYYSQSCDLCQLGIKVLPLHLPFGIRFGLQKTGVVTVS